MNSEEVFNYLRSCGISEEQIKVIEEGFSCEDAISRQTGEDAIKKLKDILEEATETDNSVCYVTSDDADALKAAIEAIEQIGCLTGRPCDVCRFKTENGCSRFECVFKGV